MKGSLYVSRLESGVRSLTSAFRLPTLDPKTWVASLCSVFQLLVEIGQGVFEEFAMPRMGACLQLL